MSTFKNIQFLKNQIIDTQKLLNLASGEVLMTASLTSRLNRLKKELQNIPSNFIEPKVKLLFSGRAVMGSIGIKSDFAGKTIKPFQELVKTQSALISHGRVGKRGSAKSSSDLYLTALPSGSFGVELSHLNNADLFSESNVGNAINNVISIIEDTSKSDSDFERVVESLPKRSLVNLKNFLKEIVEEDSILKMESGSRTVEIPKEKVAEAYRRVDTTISEDSEIIINAIVRGFLLDSGKFELTNQDTGRQINGFISEDISEEQLIKYDQQYLNKPCRAHLRTYTTIFKSGNPKIVYELLEILPEK